MKTIGMKPKQTTTTIQISNPEILKEEKVENKKTDEKK